MTIGPVDKIYNAYKTGCRDGMADGNRKIKIIAEQVKTLMTKFPLGSGESKVCIDILKSIKEVEE